MKKLNTLIFAGLLLIAGCTNESNFLTTDENQTSGPEWITLPQRSGGLSIETVYSVTAEINGEEGGKLQINEIYSGGPYNNVQVFAKLTFPKNCFKGTETITMTVDQVNGTVTYSPSMNFDIPALLDLDFKGINLTGINPDEISFVYHNPDGHFDIMECDRITVFMNSGTIFMKDGQVPHFSRYGFSR